MESGKSGAGNADNGASDGASSAEIKAGSIGGNSVAESAIGGADRAAVSNEGQGGPKAKEPTGRASKTGKKRGWPAGRPRTAKSASADADGTGRVDGTVAEAVRIPLEPGPLAEKIFGLHQVGAIMTGVPEIALQPVEAEMLAKSVAELSKHYDLNLELGKWGAWAGLLAACGMVYGPRAKAIYARNRAAKAAAKEKATQPASPFDMHPAPEGGFNFGGMTPAN